jgi:hypothetical protein
MGLNGLCASGRRTNNNGEQATGERRNCNCTSTFRRSSQYRQTIKLVDEVGNRTSKIQEGRMSITSHSSVLAALENRVNQFRGKDKSMDDHLVLAAWAVDKTGTVDASFLLNSESEINERLALTEHQEQNRVMVLGISDEVLQVHSVAPSSKGGGVVRLIYENVNGLSNKLSDNKKGG